MFKCAAEMPYGQRFNDCLERHQSILWGWFEEHGVFPSYGEVMAEYMTTLPRRPPASPTPS